MTRPRPEGQATTGTRNRGEPVLSIDNMFSREGARWRAASMSVVMDAAAAAGPAAVGLHVGLPPADGFPFDRLTATLRGGGPTISLPNPLAAQQYSVRPRGAEPLRAWLSAHVARLHAPPAGARHDIVVTTGSMPALGAVFRLFLDAGDTLLCEQFTYCQVMEAFLAPRDVRAIGVAMDGEGILPAALEAAIAAEVAAGRPPPKLLYTIPTGQNPTGATASGERRRAVYEVCRRHGVLIVEDDPYFYLQHRRPAADDDTGAAADAGGAAVGWPPATGGGSGGSPARRGAAAAAAEPAAAAPPLPPGLHGLVPSYLSLDTDGRVIRLDSFSKILAPGLRLGWVTAGPEVTEKLAAYTICEHMGGCALTQAFAGALLASWGDDGFGRHIGRLRDDYGRRAAVLHGALQRHVGELACWSLPQAGMFLWLRAAAPGASTSLHTTLAGKGVVTVPAGVTQAGSDEGGDSTGESEAAADACPYVRLCFANASDEDLVLAAARIGAALACSAAAKSE